MMRWIGLIVVGMGMSAAAAFGAVRDAVDWSAFMERHDLVWDEKLPAHWQEGAFLGNGLLGLMIYQPWEPHGGNRFHFTHREEEENSLRFDVGRSDVHDHRPGNRILFDQTRLPIGHFLITPTGKITDGEMRLDLWNAEARGTLVTDRGEIAWRALILSEKNVMIIEVEPTEGERDFKWAFVDAVSETPRLYRWDTEGYGRDRPQDKYPANPQAERADRGDYTVMRQTMLAGGDYSTAWKNVASKDGKKRYYISVGYSLTDDVSGSDEAVEAIRDAEASSFEELVAAHRAWWHAYYPLSFVSFPDSRLESFYWIQMYKLGAATRADKPALDLMGPWFRHTIWPGMWWNLNIQLTYYPVYTANRLEIGESLNRMLDENRENLLQNGRNRRGAMRNSGFIYEEDTDVALVARMTTSGNLLGGMFRGQRGRPEIQIS